MRHSVRMAEPLAQLLPFRIEFSQRALDDMRRRIEDYRWPNIGYDAGWATGTRDTVLRDLVRYWLVDFDWFAVQAALNERAHVRGDIEGEAMHAMVAAGPAAEHRTPLLLIHGWPNSFADFSDVSTLLTQPDEAGAAFDVVAPSLPGFGFSDPPRAPGLHPGRIAERLHTLMRSLGYERYGVQGGDWGAIIGTALSLRHPEAVIGLHLNHAPNRTLPPDGPPLTEVERAYLDAQAAMRFEESGYVAIQGSRPQTLGYAHNDSPVGLLAWMLEKFWAWSDHGQGAAEGTDDLWSGNLTRDRVLRDVTLYWLTGTALSASRIYYERAHTTDPFLDGFVEAPTAFLRFPRDPWGAPQELLARSYHLVQYSQASAGGHFPALEQPDLLASDIRGFFGRLI
jgi:pimeloyl-ACP methyl ester carboxylesterase